MVARGDPTREDLERGFSDPVQLPVTFQQLRERLRHNRTLPEFHFANRLVAGLAPEPRGALLGRSLRLALLTSWTSDFLDPLLNVDFALDEIHAELYRPHFNQFRQELLDPQSGVYRFGAEITFVAFRLEDVFPARVAAGVISAGEGEACVDEVTTLAEGLVGAWKRHASGGTLFVTDILSPWTAWTPLEGGGTGWPGVVARINTRLREIASATSGVHVFGLTDLVTRRGRDTWVDPRLLYTARLPVAPQHWLALSDAIVRHTKAALGLGAKCLVLDLDGTLWGGVLGEDGPTGIRLGETYPGSVYRDVQRHILELHEAGTVLAIVSKNDVGEVLSVLREHPAMLLRERHFAAIRVNWNDKATNINEIAHEIGLPIEQLLFVDDNPVEIAAVRNTFPNLGCLQMESPPFRFAEQLRDLRLFDRLALTAEDRARGVFYAQERERRALRVVAPTLDEFYRSLAQRLTLYENHAAHLSRISQLSLRTNQFNMTTVRLSDDDATRLLADPACLLVTAELTDSLGESGLIAYAQVHRGPRRWHVENLAVSCRVLGRGVEEALVDYLGARALEGGASELTAEYARTKKNSPFADFYNRVGFEVIEETDDGHILFRCEPRSHATQTGKVAVVVHGA
jgi:FkbH-like protein